MSLKCLLIADASTMAVEIATYLETLKVELINGRQSIDYDRSLLRQQIDLIVIAVSKSDAATFLAEELSRIVPRISSIFVFDVAILTTWSFTKLMDSMVDWSVASDDLDRLDEIVDTIYDRLFTPIRRSQLGVRTTPRELEVLSALQEGLNNKEICSRLNMSATVLDKHIGTLGTKFNCNGRILVAIRSMREFGDLVGKL